MKAVYKKCPFNTERKSRFITSCCTISRKKRFCFAIMYRRKKIFRRRKLREILPINKMFPNIITLLSLFSGMAQVKFALAHKWEAVVACVLVSALLDASDGRLARLLNSCSRFGAELDSLVDFAAFGVAPAISVYLFNLHELGRMGWIVVVLFAVCMCLRLARFNTKDIEHVKTPLSGRFFTGVPAPAGAVLAELPIILFNAFEDPIFLNEKLGAIIVLITGLLCVSTIPTPSIKKAHLKRGQFIPFLLVISLVVAVAFIYTWKALSALVVIYLISIIFCYRKAKRILREAQDSADVTQTHEG